MNDWFVKHGSTVTAVLLALGAVQQYAQLVPTWKYAGVAVMIAGALVKVIQSLMGLTSSAGSPPA